MTEKIKLLLELTVDPDRFDLTDYLNMAEDAGWGRDVENGIIYLAEDMLIAETNGVNGVTLDWLP